MIDVIVSVPASIKIGVSFFAILLIYRIGVPLGWSIIASAVGLALWTGLGGQALLLQAQALGRPENYLLFGVILSLLFFTEALSKSGRMQETVTALKNWLRSKKLLIAGLPALVGLLPMPGGAVFSAPLVDSVDCEKALAPSQKVAINYWFRHIWEYWWPLYPGVILAIQYSGLPVGVYLATMMPFTVLSVAGGYWFILRKIPQSTPKSHEVRAPLAWRDAMATLGPVFVLVIISVAGSGWLPQIGVRKELANLVSMLAGMSVSLLYIFVRCPGALAPAARMLLTGKTWSLMLVVLGVQMFAIGLKIPLAEEVTLVSLLRDELLAWGVPVIAIMIILPAIAGMVTGFAAGYVGASFPIIFALLPPHASLSVLAATVAFSYSFGYIGMLLSPVHVCFVVTNEYFKTRLFKTYPYIIGPIGVILAGAFLLSGAYLLLGRL